MRTRTPRISALLAVAALVAAGCGSVDSSEAPTGTTAGGEKVEPDARWDEGAWLLRFNTAGGAEGESVRAVYVRFTPSTGATTVRALPALTSPDTSAGAQALMVSADQRFALLDSRVSASDRREGRLTLYPLDGDGTEPVDVRGWSGTADLRPVAAAFDPGEAAVLRVVDTEKRVWRVDLDARTAERDGELPGRSGWIYANGFDKNTGLPYVEDIDSPETDPPGNGDDDVRPVDRRGGVIRTFDEPESSSEPALPCGFAGGFTLTDGTAWLFCADTPRITTYRLAPKADAWEEVGTASDAVVPATAAEVPVVLPPVGDQDG